MIGGTKTIYTNFITTKNTHVTWCEKYGIVEMIIFVKRL